MAELVGVILIFGVMAFMWAVMYKKRYWIAKWLEHSEWASNSDPKNKIKRLRRQIEDAEEEISMIENISTLEEE